MLAAVLCSSPLLAADDRFEIPGGAAAIRAITGLPAYIPDAMLLVEVARTWYGERAPLVPTGSRPARLLAHLVSSNEAAGAGPLTLLPATTWTALLKPAGGESLAAALVRNREAMLLYHGLAGMEDETLRWIDSNPDLLRQLLDRGAPAFAFAAPAIHLEAGVVTLPGGPAARQAWEQAVGASAAEPHAFLLRLMQRDGGRMAWMFSVLQALDDRRLRFAIGRQGEYLPALLRHFARIAPQGNLVDRPFWRPTFDPALLLLLIDLPSDGLPRGDAEFWRQVFRSQDLDRWRAGAGEPLTAPGLLDLIFREPYGARDRWLVFARGQRLLAASPADAASGLSLRGAVRHPALAAMMERCGIGSPAQQLAVHRAAARLTAANAGGRHGALVLWQSALALVERASLTGGFTRDETEAALSELASLNPRDMPAALAGWLLETLLPRLLARPGAPASPERALLQTMAGALQAGGPRRQQVFQWEDLSYALAGPEAAARRMQVARATQRTPSLDAVLQMWQSGGRERTRAEQILAEVLTAVTYAPHLAATDDPALGADVAVRHALTSPRDVPGLQRLRPWILARPQVHARIGWHLEGSLLGLDLSLADWYLRQVGEPASAAPSLDEADGTSLLLLSLLAMTTPARLELEEALQAVDTGRRLAAAQDTAAALDAQLASAGVDPWRRRALKTGAASPASIVSQLTLSEAWRLGGAVGQLTPRLPVDGCACLGTAPERPGLLEGRRSAGLAGAVVPDAVLRVAVFLQTHGLPLALAGEILAGAIGDVMHGVEGVRPDDRLALALAGVSLSDSRLEEHMLALIGAGVLARPRPMPESGL
jgi:hypothetical protein